jgi:hypothetical protein
MPRTKGDGRHFYVGRKQRPPTGGLTEDEWAEVASHSKIVGSEPFSKALREDLNDAIDVFAKHGFHALKVVPANDVIRKFDAWTRQTNKFRAEFKKNVLVPTASNATPKQILLAGRIAPKRILKKYFGEDRYNAERLTADDLAFVLQGVIKFTRSILYRVNETSARRIEPIDFWLIWAALLISIFRKHKVKFARRTNAGKNRQQFRAEVIEFIFHFQKKLPNLKFARSDPSSMRKALKLALPLARRENIQALKRILRMWSAGDFDPYEGKGWMGLHGIHAKTKRILDKLDGSKEVLRSLNKNALKNRIVIPDSIS